MGRLPEAPLEIRLAATLFLLLLGIADAFGAWQVKNFASFTPGGLASTLSVEDISHGAPGVERPIDLTSLEAPRHHIDRQLLAQDTHVHIPAYALTAALLSLIVMGLRLGAGQRCALVLLLFGAPLLDFVGLWGAHLSGSGARLWGAAALAGGFAMGIAWLLVSLLTLAQCWIFRKGIGHA